MSLLPTLLSCRQMGFCLLLAMALFTCQSGRAQPTPDAVGTAGKPMPNGEIQTILVGAKRMTVKDILDSVAAHRRPDINPFMLRTTLSMRLYNDTMTYFSFRKEGYLNKQHPKLYSFNMEKGSDQTPDTNRLLLEQEGRQRQYMAYAFIYTQTELVYDKYLKEIQEYGRPAYKVDTAGPDAQIHLFFFINKTNWYMNSYNRSMRKGDTAKSEIVRFHKIDIDRATWTVRHKESGALKAPPEMHAFWNAAQTYDQYNALLERSKLDPTAQMDIETISYAILGDSFLVPVSRIHRDNFSPVAGASLLGKKVLNPENSTFELTISNTTTTDKPHNPDYHFMRVVGLEQIFRSPFGKEKKR